MPGAVAPSVQSGTTKAAYKSDVTPGVAIRLGSELERVELYIARWSGAAAPSVQDDTAEAACKTGRSRP